jgi:predicted chitinase
MDQSQVDGVNALLDAAPPAWDARWTAYALATAYHESARTMQPIREYGRGAGHTYGIIDPITGQYYYGRGYVQLTWKADYKVMSVVVGEDLVANADLALRPDLAAKILFYGMGHGSFTGVGLARYFNGEASDWINARRVINGTDCAAQIAAYGQEFHSALA